MQWQKYIKLPKQVQCDCLLLNSTTLKYLEGVESAAKDKEAIVAQRCHHPQSGQVADQVYLTDTGIVMDHLK